MGKIIYYRDVKGSNLRPSVYDIVNTMKFHPCRNERVRLLLHNKCNEVFFVLKRNTKRFQHKQKSGSPHSHEILNPTVAILTHKSANIKYYLKYFYIIFIFSY